MICLELFFVFFYIGLFTFGGGYAMIPLIQEETVARGWITFEEINNFIAISESTPGPFAINISTFIGHQVGGILGAACATLGVVLPSFIIILILACIIAKVSSKKHGKGTFISRVKPIVVGLILATATTFVLKGIFFTDDLKEFSFNRSGLGIFGILVFIFFYYKKKKKKSINPILIIGISALLGLLIYGLF